MEALGLAIPTPAGAENFALPPASGTAARSSSSAPGSPGLVSAYELRRAGYRGDGARSARSHRRPRRGPSAAATGSSRSAGPTSVATFDPGLYFNAGPARIPVHAPRDPRLRAPVRRRSSRRSSTSTATPAGISAARSSPSGGWSRTCAATSASCWPRRSTAMRSTRRCPRTSCDAVRQFLAPYARARRQGRYAPGRARRALRSRGGGYAPGAGAAAAARLQGAARRTRGGRSCPICSSISGTCRRPCSSRSAAWIASPTPFTSR